MFTIYTATSNAKLSTYRLAGLAVSSRFTEHFGNHYKVLEIIAEPHSR